MKAVLAAFNQEEVLVGAFSVITNLQMELFEALVTRQCSLDILILSKYFANDFRAERSLEDVINATTTVIIEAFESTTVSLKA